MSTLSPHPGHAQNLGALAKVCRLHTDQGYPEVDGKKDTHKLYKSRKYP